MTYVQQQLADGQIPNPIEPDPDGIFRCKVPGCTYQETENKHAFQMHVVRAHQTAEQEAKWRANWEAGMQAKKEREAIERLGKLLSAEPAQEQPGNVLEELAETEAVRQQKLKDAERKRLQRLAKSRKQDIGTDELFRRVGKAIDVMYPKITGEMIPELHVFFVELAQRLDREHE